MDMTMGEPQNIGTRWVCPNDRHLALRAKLRTGWSVKTGYLDSGWNNYSNVGGNNRANQSFVLTEEERRTIIQVIQRAEALDLSEQKRIGRLVERLEDMKRNVRIITSSRSDERRNCGNRCSGGTRCVCSCALCGEKFGAVLGATPTFCKDCRKYVCQKCGKEANTPNVLAVTSNTEVISTTTCNTLANETLPKRTAIQRIVQRSSNNPQKIFLCRICIESREIWKKSGAWFFKGMPKHDLPKKKERDWSRAGQRTQNSSCKIISACKSLESNEVQDSSSEEEAARRLVGSNNCCSSSSPSLQGIQDINGLSKQQQITPYDTQTASGSFKMVSRSNDRSSPIGHRDESPSTTTMDRLDKSSTFSIYSQCSRLSPSTSAATLRNASRTNEKSTCDLRADQRGGDNSIDDNASIEEIKLENKGDEQANYLEDSRGSVDRCKDSQVQSVRYTEFAVDHIAEHSDGTNSGRGLDARKKCRMRDECLLKSDERSTNYQHMVRASLGLTKEANAELHRNEEVRNGGKLWDSGNLLAIRPSGSVPPVQSGTSIGIKAYGHPRPRRSILQNHHTADGNGHKYQANKNENCSQDTRSSVQRDGELLRFERCRYEEWQSLTCHDTSRRPLGRRLSRGGEVSPVRTRTVPDEALQNHPPKPLSGESRRRGLGSSSRQPRSNTTNSELLYPSTCSTGYYSPSYESFAHGQQRVF
ncbi:PREDICTED: uncharacterized protein LOC107065408 isoform X2 [Polistes dominula]|uniref:Uncharacterized protein LOC107065408 isoform X2 n=1 Tax=Polistes dominula TaxID=743375 RepID=A0ABM1I2W7_POLDO|nr:PREDICTED: uncharacterized protein LOC107065408 isoform X2 [Polistes dominula]